MAADDLLQGQQEVLHVHVRLLCWMRLETRRIGAVGVWDLTGRFAMAGVESVLLKDRPSEAGLMDFDTGDAGDGEED